MFKKHLQTGPIHLGYLGTLGAVRQRPRENTAADSAETPRGTVGGPNARGVRAWEREKQAG